MLARLWIGLPSSVCLFAVAGCPPGPAGPGRQGGVFPAESPAESATGSGETPRAPGESVGRLELRFDVLRVQVPRGTVSQSHKLWNHVDEDVLSFDQAQQLRRNGLRVGLGTEGSWPAIKAILNTTPGTVSLNNSVHTRDLAPLGVQLKDCPYEQTIFLYRGDGQLTGSTFPPGRLQLRQEPLMEPGDLSVVTLRIVPELQCEAVEFQWKVTAAGPRQVPMARGRLFEEVAFAVAVPQGSFLVIGPSSRIDRPRLVGAVFLADELDGRPTEWIVFVTPAVVQTSNNR